MSGIGMYRNVDEALRLTVPAAKIAAAVDLSGKYKMSQQEIAKSLGVTQAAVSKYLSGKYSAGIGTVVKGMLAKGLQKRTTDAVAKAKGKERVLKELDIAASDPRIVKVALGLL